MIKKWLPLSLSALILCGSITSFAAETKIYQGLGHSTNFRVGPGKDSEGQEVYSFNYVDAAVIFDADGKIVNAIVDALEISTPNYDGESMPHFSGWPGTEGHNLTDHQTKKVIGKTVNELEIIFTKLYSDVNGRPLKKTSTNEKDKEKYAKLTETEKAEVADITAGATMSLRDSHGDILGALKNAYQNRVEVTFPTK